ncbi:MAG: hypothetical protein Q4E33_01220 [Erysipelotrichaceae bacterium]|nr:hypothetical protein [Erysipelotrichaceae bacterium]
MEYLVKFTDSKIENIILNICILLFGINFLYKCNYIVMGTFVLLLLFKRFKISFGNLVTLITLLLFSISWFIFSDGHEIAGVCLPLCYLIGCNIDEKDENGVIKFILLVTTSLAIYTTLFFINNAITNGITNYDITNQINIWNGQPLWPTNLMLYSSLFYGCFGYIVFGKVNKYVRLFYLIIFVVNAYYAMMLSRRAALLMIALSFSIAFAFKFFFDKEINRKKLIKTSMMICIIGLICFMLLFATYKLNLFGFKEIVKQTDLYIRFIGSGRISSFFSDMGRSYYRKEFMQYFFDYPWGGSNIREIVGNYSHDLWLDVYDVAGIISMILIIVSSILLIVKAISVLKNKTISVDYKMLVISLFICVLAQCCLEPIMEACRAYMFGVCMIHGSLEVIQKGKNV